MILKIAPSEVVQSMLVEVSSLSKSLKPKLKNQKSYHKTFYLFSDNKDSFYKLKAVFYTRWWKEDDKGAISSIMISSPKGATKKYFFNSAHVQESIKISLEKSIFGESDAK
jgi:hypothetical protein